MLPTGRKKSLRLSAHDYIASIARSSAYAEDFKVYQQAIAEERRENRVWNPEADPTKVFLKRWPLLIEPIDPEKARRSTTAFLDHLVPPVFIQGADIRIPEWWYENVDALPWPEGRFLSVLVNLYRSEDEIIGYMKDLLKKHRLGNRKTLGQKSEGMPDRWEIWDTFQGPGKKDAKQTAAILFPKSFRFEDDRREMEEEARKACERKIAGGMKKGPAMNWHDTRIEKAKAAEWRIAERRRLMVYVRDAVRACDLMIAEHEPAREGFPLYRVF